MNGTGIACQNACRKMVHNHIILWVLVWCHTNVWTRKEANWSMVECMVYTCAILNQNDNLQTLSIENVQTISNKQSTCTPLLELFLGAQLTAVTALAFTAVGCTGRETSVTFTANLTVTVGLGSQNLQWGFNDTTTKTEERIENCQQSVQCMVYKYPAYQHRGRVSRSLSIPPPFVLSFCSHPNWPHSHIRLTRSTLQWDTYRRTKCNVDSFWML